MSSKTILITGANGEIGHGLIEQLSEQGSVHIVAMDMVPLDESIRLRCHRIVTGDILDSHLLETLSTEHNLTPFITSLLCFLHAPNVSRIWHIG